MAWPKRRAAAAMKDITTLLVVRLEVPTRSGAVVGRLSNDLRPAVALKLTKSASFDPAKSAMGLDGESEGGTKDLGGEGEMGCGEARLSNGVAAETAGSSGDEGHG